MELLDGFQEALRRYLVLRGARSDYATLLGHRVHHYALAGKGKGPPIVLVHGLGGSANGFFKTFLPLARRFPRVLAVDLPGNGFSPVPGTGALTLRAQFDVLSAYFESVVGEPAFVVGNSLGGALCIMLAAERPQHVRALGLVAPAGAQVGRDQLVHLFRDMDVKTAGDARRMLRRLFHRVPVGLLLAAPVIKPLYGTPAVKATIGEVLGGDTLSLAPEVFQKLSMPTLLLWGGSEKLLPYEGIDYFRAHLPAHALVDVVEGFGHVPQVERPRELVSRLVAFADGARL